MFQFGVCYFLLTTVASVYTFQLRTFHPNKTGSKKKIRKCKKQSIKDFLFLYYIQAKCGDIADKNANAADDDKRTFNYRWPKCPWLMYLICPTITCFPFFSVTATQLLVVSNSKFLIVLIPLHPFSSLNWVIWGTVSHHMKIIFWTT